MIPRILPALLLLGSVAPAAEPPPAVLDNEHLFGKVAIERVAQIAADLRQLNNFDLCIETMKEVPGLPLEKQRKMKDRAVYEAMRQAAQNRADDLNVRGLYVMITTSPKHVTVVGWPEDRERDEETSDYKREQLRRRLAKLDLAREPDATLLSAVEHYRSLVRRPARVSPLNALPAVAVAGGLFAAWLVLSLLARSRDPHPIYQPAMLGSIFGVPAGFWINDRLFEAERPAPTSPVVETLAAPPSERIMEPESVPIVPNGDHA